jgi:peptidoglycan/xylan/chitin deacetylase (PgdA/CDA1 family)
MNTKSGRGLWKAALVGLGLCLQAVPATAGNPKTIIFRDDDASVYFCTELLAFITDTLITNGIPHTIAVIPANTYGETLGEDPVVVAYLNSIKANPKVELALHGYEHAPYEFAGLTLTQAQAKISAGLTILGQVLGITPTTFIPPYNAFNTDTFTACKNAGLTRFSAASYNDPHPFAEAPAGLLHVPSTVDFQDWGLGGDFKSSAAIIQEAQNSLDANDVALFTIHFWAFGDENENLIPAHYQTLLDVISWALQKQSEGVTLMTIGQYSRMAKIIGVSGNLAFGNVTTGTTATATLTIANSGNTALTISGITYPSGFSGAWSGTVAAGGSQNVPVTFAPTAVKTYSGTVAVNSDATSGTATLPASGAGIAPVTPTKIISLSGNLAFGNVTTGTTATATLTIANSGNTALTVSGITYPSGFSGAWSGTVAAGGSQNVPVTFAPTAVKTYSGNVTVKSDKTSGTATKAASGKGIAATRIISLSGNLAFGNVATGTTATNTLTIANSGTAALTVSSITYPSGFSGAWSGTVAAGSFHNVAVTFAPTAIKSYTGNVRVNSDKTSGTATKAASGTGIAPATLTRVIGLSGNLALGNVTTGTTATATVTITNSGNATLTVSGITYPSGFSGAWSGTIVAGGSQNVTVTFAPTAVATYGGTVTVNSDATSGTATLPASGAGIAVVTQLLQVTIQLSSDDAYEAGGQVNTSAPITVAGLEGTTIYRAGYRFASVGLPKSARVTSARLKLAYNWASVAEVNTLLYGEAEDSSATFSATASNISGRTRTTSSVLWNAMPITTWGAVLASPDITAIVQEIVARPQWLSGNPITILQYESGPAQGAWEAVTIEGIVGTSCSAAVLEIEYTP